MRAVVQRCQHLGPRMHSLVTLGAQHQGVMAVPGCPEGGGINSTMICRIMQACTACCWFTYCLHACLFTACLACALLQCSASWFMYCLP